MNRHATTLGALALGLPLLLAGCATHDSSSSASPSSSASASATGAASWSYTGSTDPEHWGDVSTTCATGTAQSPINIDRTDLTHTATGVPEIHYQATTFEVENNGHTIEAAPANHTDNYVVIDGTQYFLQQFHLHTTSEHTIDGKHADLELHLVNKSADGAVAVLGVLFNTGEVNPTLAGVFDSMPKSVSADDHPESIPGTLNPADLLPAGSEVLEYEGSLTTPPCTEGVRWNVYETPGSISAEQLSAFQALYPKNARPVQELDGRSVNEVPAS